MGTIDRWLEYFDRKGIRYSHSTHARAATALLTADAERIPADEIAKTVVYFSETGFGIAMVSAVDFVDLAKVARLLSLPYIRLANEEELLALFPDCELGAMPPFGNPFILPVIIDAGLAKEFIAFTLATHRDVVRMSFADFERLANPTVAVIASGQEAHAYRGHLC